MSELGAEVEIGDSRTAAWQKVFDNFHADAAIRLPPGTRYEIRITPADASWVHNDIMNNYSAWIDVPGQEADYYRVGRYTTPKEPT